MGDRRRKRNVGKRFGKNQILKRLRVPLLIYTGKILQDYQNGLGVFISKDEMRFVTNGDVKHDILNTFSSGQLSGFVLAFLFSMNKQYVKESEDDLGFILIDDPVQTMDDINISSMIEVLRNDFKDRQIILSTHETDKENKKTKLCSREGTGISACSFPACRDGYKCLYVFVKWHF